MTENRHLRLASAQRLHDFFVVDFFTLSSRVVNEVLSEKGRSVQEAQIPELSTTLDLRDLVVESLAVSLESLLVAAIYYHCVDQGTESIFGFLPVAQRITRLRSDGRSRRCKRS